VTSTRLRVIHRSLREQYKIELRIRNHSTLTRRSLIEAVADSVPKQLKVDLEAPEVFVLVEVFKVRHQLIRAVTTDLSNHSDWLPLFQNCWRQSTCGVSVVRDYYKLKKFNVVEVASEGARGDTEAASGRS